jgi:hypothetical protein
MMQLQAPLEMKRKFEGFESETHVERFPLLGT